MILNDNKEELPLHLKSVLRSLIGKKIIDIHKYSTCTPEEFIGIYGEKKSHLMFAITDGPIEIFLDDGLKLLINRSKELASVKIQCSNSVSQNIYDANSNNKYFLIKYSDEKFSDGSCEYYIGKRIAGFSVFVIKSRVQKRLLKELPYQVGLCVATISGKKLVIGTGVIGSSSALTITGYKDVTKFIHRNFNEVSLCRQKWYKNWPFCYV